MDSINEGGIIIYDELSVMRHRMSSIFQDYNIQVYEAANMIELFKLFSDRSIRVDLILMDLGANSNKGFENLSRIKERKPYTPIFILTGNNKRQIFLRGIAEGAADYILKPFEDEYLLEKVLPIIKKKKLESMGPAKLVFDIRTYLSTELCKAQKGKYEITIMMCALFDKKNEINMLIENKHLQEVDEFYANVKSKLWDTDVFERYGPQTFIGIFPYGNLKNVDKIKQKMKESFDFVMNESKEIMLQMVVSTLTYPTQNPDPKSLFLALGMQMHDEVEAMRKSISSEE